ncbi:MAG: GAF domain-containing SpoIIE family protein phosphatase [Candidatus Zixiibacteriota bacterium]
MNDNLRQTKKEQLAQDDMTLVETKQSARQKRFSERRLLYITRLFDELRPNLGDAGLAVVIYHRKRLELEIHLMTATHASVYSMRDVIAGEYEALTLELPPEDNPVLQNLAGTLESLPAKRRAFAFPPMETASIAEMLFVFGDHDFENLSRLISERLEDIRLNLQNSILIDTLLRIELELELIQETGTILSMSIRLEDVFKSIVAALEKLISFDAIGIYILRQKGETIDELFSSGYRDSTTREMLKLKAGKGLVGWVAKTGEPVIVPNVQQDRRYVPARPETMSELVVPLFSGSEVIGAFNLESDHLDAYSPSDLEMVTAFANQASLSVIRARLIAETFEKNKIKEQLQVAREIQKSFQPSKPLKYPGYDVDAVNISSEEVGGDYFDFIPIVDNQLGVTIADVSGKGLPASLIMASFRASLIAEIRNNYAIRTILRKVNNLICESVEKGKFVTAVYGVLDMKNRIFTFANAGHNPPILLRATGEVEFLTTGGWTLGIMTEREYEERPIHIRDGDILALYTDGVTEAESPTDELFGTERLVELVKANRHRTAKEMRETIIEEIIRFRDPVSQPDDLTIVIIKAI